MKKSIVISVFCLFLFGINCAAEEQETPENSKKILLVWDQLFDNISEKLSKLESDCKAEKKHWQESNSKVNDHRHSRGLEETP